MEILDFKTPVPSLNFNTADNGVPLSQQENEWELQERAGLDRSTRFEEVRKELAANQFGDEMATLYQATENSLNNGMAPEEAAMFIESYNPTNGEDQVNVSLERAAAENAYTTALNDNPRTAYNAYIDSDDNTDMQTKDNIFTTWVKSNQEYYNNLGFFKKFGAFTANVLLPEKLEVWRLRGLLPDEIKEGTGWSKQALTDKFRDTLEMAYEQLPAKEYEQYLNYISETFRGGKKFGAVDDFMFQAFLKDAEEGITGWQDAFGVLDVASIGTTLAARTAARFMTKTVAKAAAGDITGLCAEAKKAFKNGEDLKDFITPSAAKPTQNAASISSDSRVAEMIGDEASFKEAQEFLNKHINTGIYSDEELKRMSDKVKTDVKRVFTPKSSDPVDLYVHETDDGNLIATALFGDGEGKALDAAAAGRLARHMGYEKGTYQVVKKDGAGYYVQVNKDVSKSSNAYGRELYQTCMGTVEDNDKYVKEWRFDKDVGGLFNTITRVFGGSTRIGAEAHARGVQADRIANAVRSYIDTTFKKSYRSLNKKDRRILDDLYKEGQRENGGYGKWYSREELDSKGVSEQIQKSYFDFKTVSDLAYLANNAEKRRELVRKGYKMYGDYAGIKVNLDSVKGSNYIITDSSGKIIPTSRVFSLNPDEFTLVKVHRGTAVQDNLTATHVLLHNGDATVSELPTFVTHYMPGGRREYMNGTMFVKIGRSWFNPSTGTDLNGYAKTLIAGTDKKALEKYAEEVNKVINIWDNPVTDDLDKARELAALDLQYFKVNSWEDVKKLIRSKDNPSGIIDPKYRAQVLEKNGTYTYNNNLATIQEDLNDVDWAMQDLLATRSQLYRGRGNLLDDVNGGTAHIMNIQDIMDKTADKAVYTLAKGDMAHWYAKDLERFKSVITNWDDLQKYSDLDKINKAVLLDSMSANPEQLKMIRSARRYLEHGWRTLNGRTKYDKILENTMLKTAKVVDAVLPGNFRTTDAFEYIANFNPAKIAKAIGFNYVMGWWNPAQLYKQGLGVLNVIALEPKRATQAFSAYPTVRLALASRGKNKAIYNTYKAAGMKLTGLNADEFEDMLEFMERYGTKKSSGLLVANEYGATLRGDKGLGKRIWDSQYMFMNEGNAANYFVADITAYMARKGKGYKEIAAYSDDLFLNMTKTSESAFQRGQFLPTSVFTQWMTYPTRMMEAMTNSRLTKAQRLRLAGTQFLLWGVGGTMLTERQELNMYTSLQQHGLTQGQADFVTNGLLGYLAKEKGIYFDEGLHILEQMDFVGNMAGLFIDQELKFPTIPAAQAVNQGVAVVKAAVDLINPEAGEQDLDRWAFSVATRKSMPSSLKNLTKAIIAWKYHNFYNNKGQQINKEDVETYRAVMQALGFQPYEQKYDRMMQVALTQKDEVIKDALESLKPLADNIRFYEGVDVDPDKRSQYLDMLYHEWDLNTKVVRASIGELYPEGDALSKLDKGLANLFYNGNTTETLEVKTTKGLGPNYQEMLYRKIKENE